MMHIANIIVIAQSTFREAVRGKHLLAIALASSAIILIAMCFGSVTVGEQDRVVKDFGLFAASFSAAAYASIAGSSFLEKEIKRKTLYNLLSKSVHRSDFVIGKWLGLVSTAIILAAILIVETALINATLTRTIDPLFGVAFLYQVLEILLTCSFAIFFSSVVVTPVLSGLFTAGLFLAGRSAAYLLYFVEQGQTSEPLTSLLKALYWGLPNLSELNVANDLVFGTWPSLSHYLFSTLYACGYSCALLLLSCILFERRNFL